MDPTFIVSVHVELCVVQSGVGLFPGTTGRDPSYSARPDNRYVGRPKGM